MAGRALRDLFVRLGIAVEGGEKLDTAKQKVDSLKSALQGLGVALSAMGVYRAVRAVRDFIDEQIAAADALKHNAEALGVSAEELQNYQYAAQLANVNVTQVAVAMRFFNRAIGEASFGTKNAVKTFAQLGINIHDAQGQVKPTGDLLFEFADKLKNIPSEAQRTALAMRTLGRGGAWLLPALQNGSQALRDQFNDVKQLGGGYMSIVEDAHKLDVQQKRLAMGWRTVSAAILKEVIPVLMTLTKQGIETVKHLIEISQKTYGFRTALIALAATVTYLSGLWLLMNPEVALLVGLFAVLAAEVAIAYLVFDDFYTFLEGGDSVLGDWATNAGIDVERLRKTFEDAFAAIRKAFGLTDDSGKSLGATLLKMLADSTPAIIKWSGLFLTEVVKVVLMAAHGIAELSMLIGGLFKAVAGGGMGALRKAWDDVDKDNEAVDRQVTALGQAQDAFNMLGKKPGSPGGPPLAGANISNANGTEQAVGAGAAASYSAPQMSTAPISVTNNITVHAQSSSPKDIGDAAASGAEEGTMSSIDQHKASFDAMSTVAPGL